MPVERRDGESFVMEPTMKKRGTRQTDRAGVTLTFSLSRLKGKRRLKEKESMEWKGQEVKMYQYQSQMRVGIERLSALPWNVRGGSWRKHGRGSKNERRGGAERAAAPINTVAGTPATRTPGKKRKKNGECTKKEVSVEGRRGIRASAKRQSEKRVLNPPTQHFLQRHALSGKLLKDRD